MKATTAAILCFLGAVASVEENKLAMKHPTIEQLQSIKDISDSDILPDYVHSVIEHSEGEIYDHKVKHAVENHLSEHASNWYFVTTFLGMWSNGGMQQVLLCESDEVHHKQWELKKTVKAFRAFGCKQTAKFIEQLIPKSAEWSKGIAELNRREESGEEVSEEAFDKIWSEVDAFDEPFEEGFEQDPDVFEAMTKAVQLHPDKYLQKTNNEVKQSQ